MSYTYKRVFNSRTKKWVFHHGSKIVKQADVPAHILEILERDGEYNEEHYALNPPKICMICGEFGKYTRFINLKTVVLCAEHYNNLTVGKVVEALRNKEHAESTN